MGISPIDFVLACIGCVVMLFGFIPMEEMAANWNALKEEEKKEDAPHVKRNIEYYRSQYRWRSYIVVPCMGIGFGLLLAVIIRNFQWPPF